MKNRFRIYLFFIGVASMLNYGCIERSDDATIPDLSDVYTTLDRTIVPNAPYAGTTVSIDDPANFLVNGFGKWHWGPGLPYQKRLDLMYPEYDNTTVRNAATLLRFFTITDIHVTDKESPAQGIVFSKYSSTNGISCYTPLMLYSTHVLDAAIRTVNRLNKKSPIDFGLALGDMANSTQYNELRWFIDIMDGKRINPDSGADDDPVKGPDNDYQDEFQAEGLNSSIPWYAAIGNHDHFWMGVKPVNERIRNYITSDSILQIGNVLSDPEAFTKSTFSCGTLDGSSLYGTIIGSGVVANMTSFPKIPADINRRSLTKAEVISEMSNTSTLPVGHGFVQSDPENYFDGCYSFEPKANLPIKVIVLDDTQDESEVCSDIYGHGTLEHGRHDWLIKQLKAGQAEDKLMIIAAHIPIGVAPNTSVGWYDATVEANLIAELKTYPNLILWVAGHRHLNTVTPFKSSDPSHPENSFWEVETKSLREFPQQFRTFDIVRNSDNTISIFVTDVDPNVKDGTFPAISRSYAIASHQIYGLQEPLNPTGSVSYNAELIKQLTPTMQARIKDYGKAITKK